MHLRKFWGFKSVIYGCLLLFFLAACTSSTPPQPTAPPASPTSLLPTPTEVTASPGTTSPSAEAGIALTSTPLPTDFWENQPVIPQEISERVREIYKLGLTLGNNPHIFSRIGDCASAAPDFLVGFDSKYNLGTHTDLQTAIDYFRGSFQRPSLAAKNGLNTAGLLTSLWTGDQCLSNESLLDCQYRLDHPGFAIISVGTNESYYVHHTPGVFEINLRAIIEDTMEKGIIPILGTKADNLEGDNSINATIALLAQEYQLPLWNFWKAAQPLPNHGLADASHLTSVSYLNFTDFSIPHSLEYGMQVRNLTALEMLNFLREQLADLSPSPTP
ncbi:MAG: hypothetical protein ACXWNC_01505 [Anaerolineales bacterium]